MSLNYFDIFHEASPEANDHAAAVGMACHLMSRVNTHAKKSIGDVHSFISAAVAHRQMKFFFDFEGKVIAYVVWAYLEADVEGRIIGAGDFRLHPSEWNEGNSLWIMDFVAPAGHVLSVLTYLRDVLFLDETRIRYFRFKNGKFFAREVSRDDQVSFFRRSAGI